MQRLLGSLGIGGFSTAQSFSTSASQAANERTVQTPQNGGEGSNQFPGGGAGQNPGGGNSGGMFNTGSAGVLRLFTEPLGGQIVWLLPLALLALFALAWQGRPHFHEKRELHALILWGTWLLTIGIFFSVAGFFHQYYLSTLAPAICALFGSGVIVMWRDYRRAGWRGWLLPLALLLTAFEQLFIINSNPTWGTWLIPVIAATCIAGAVILFVVRLTPLLRQRIDGRVLLPVLGLMLVALLLTEAVWSAAPGLQNIADDLPLAGPTQLAAAGSGGGPGNFADLRRGPVLNSSESENGLVANPTTGGNGRQGSGNFAGGGIDTALVKYLEANRDGAKYLLAVSSANDASSIILDTNQPVMALGGFTGSDPILTTSQLAALVANGTIRYFMPGGGGGNQSALTGWVTQNCTAVPSSAWEKTSTGSSGLYVCK